MISEKEVERVANLARLELSQGEKNKLAKELDSIFEYIKKLNEVDTANIEPTAQVTGLEDVFRKDNTSKLDADEVKRLATAMPSQKDGYLKVKAIFEDK